MPHIEIAFPLAGKNENLATHQQPPYTTPDLKNVRPYDTQDERARGGQRPGLVKGNSVQVASTKSPVVALVQVTTVTA